jgi:hypothetical protein
MYRRSFIILNVLILFFNSCSDDYKLRINEPNFVSFEDAISVADNIPIERGSLSRSSIKRIQTIKPILDENGITVVYVINYEDGGFLILSADNRIQPVLAYSLSSSFPLQDNLTMPSGLIQWLYSIKENVKEIRKSKRVQSNDLKKLWNSNSISNLIGMDYKKAPDPNDNPINDPEDPNCPPLTTKQIGPLLTTEWGQTGSYNDQAKYLGCTEDPDGRAPTGCVATAMAQIMKFHRFPNNYLWDNMPNFYGTYETAKLMKDIADAVDMDWGCNASGADVEDEVPSSFKNDFGYSTASYSDFNHQTVKQQLDWNRPVILRGGRNAGWGIFSVYKDGHAWVCDGYRQYTNCTTSSLYLHMNWGWDGMYNDWFAYSNWNPGGDTFNYKQGMVFNIAP